MRYSPAKVEKVRKSMRNLNLDVHAERADATWIDNISKAISQFSPLLKFFFVCLIFDIFFQNYIEYFLFKSQNKLSFYL